MKGPCRGEVGQGDLEFAGQFDANELGAPIGVECLQGAGSSDDLVVNGASTAALILRLQAVKASLLKGPPDLPDRVVGQAEFECDLREVLALKAAAYDFSTNRHVQW